MPHPDYSRRWLLKTAIPCGAAGALRGQVPVHHDVIQVGQEFQEIENFGASDCWSMQKIGGWSDEGRNRVADLLFSTDRGIGLSCWRFNIGGGVNPQITEPWRTAETFEIAEGQYDWSRQKNERWMLGAARERGVQQFLAFVNSPPGRMTRNGLTFCDRNSNPTNLKPGFEGQYARYLADILDHFRSNPEERERIDFNYVSPVNEPQWDWTGHSQEGMRADNATIHAIVQALAQELKQRRLTTEIALVESGSLPDMWQLDGKASQTYGASFGDYVHRFLDDPAFRDQLSGRIGYHSYGSDRIDGRLVSDREALGAAMRPYAGWKLWQTEYCILDGATGQGGSRRDLTMNTALEVARLMLLDLTLCGVSAWQWWLAMSPYDYKDGLLYTDWKKPGDRESIYTSRLFWTFGNFSRFIRPGMRRVQLNGDGHDIRGLMGAAFKDPRGRQVVAVYINLSAQDRRVMPAFSAGAKPWRPAYLVPYVTSDREGDELRTGAEVGPETPVDVPARSAVTICAFAGVHRRGGDF